MTSPRVLDGANSSANEPRWRGDFLVIGAPVLALAMWILSVALPVWETRADHGRWDVITGMLPLMIGFLGILVLCPAWFANLLLIPVGFKLLRRRGGFGLSFLAFAVAASAYMMPALYGDNETAVIVKRRIGFYLWLGAFLVLMLGHALQANRVDPSSALVRWAAFILVVLAVASFELLFRVGVSPLEEAIKDPNDLTALSTALAHHPSEADKDAALHWAILEDLYERREIDPRQIERLVAAGARISPADRTNPELLVAAVSRPGSEYLVRLLVSAGANVNARESSGMTILDIANERHSSAECRQVLIDAGAVSSTPATEPADSAPATQKRS
jgi:hypothetical protein